MCSREYESDVGDEDDEVLSLHKRPRTRLTTAPRHHGAAYVWTGPVSLPVGSKRLFGWKKKAAYLRQKHAFEWDAHNRWLDDRSEIIRKALQRGVPGELERELALFDEPDRLASETFREAEKSREEFFRKREPQEKQQLVIPYDIKNLFPRPLVKKRRCGACGGYGHIKTNKGCSLHKEKTDS